MKNYLGYPEEWLIESKAIHTAREISQQPAVWRELVASLTKQEAELAQFLNPL